MQIVNAGTNGVELAVYNKNGTEFSGYPKDAHGILSSCTGLYDPVAQYDRLADRWVISAGGGLGSSPVKYTECIAVSTTNDPTGTWYTWSYSYGTTLNDYEKLSVWPTATNSAYLGTANLFYANGSFAGEICAYNRAAMLSGSSSVTKICSDITDGSGSYLPSDLDGATAPPSGSGDYFVAVVDNTQLQLETLVPNFATGKGTTSTTDISVASFAFPSTGVPQLNTSETLDSLGDRLMYRLAYRNFGDHESMVVNHTVQPSSNMGVRWYELRNANLATPGQFSLYQQGTFSPDASYRWMGSAAMDQIGDIALGFSVSSSGLFPSIRATGRTPNDPLGTMETEGSLQVGGGSQTGTNRWGDYSAMRIDPSDDCTFWYTTGYYTSTSSSDWGTWFGALTFPSCASSTPDFGISPNPSSVSATFGVAATLMPTITISSLGGFNSAVNLVASGDCGGNGISCSLNPNPVTPPANGTTSSTLTVNTSTSTPVGTYTITVTGTSGALTHATNVTLVVSNVADFTIAASPPSVTVKRGASGTVQVTATAVNNVSSSVTLGVSGLPAQTTGTFSPNPVTATGSSKLTLKPGRKANPGTYTLTISGQNGNFTHSTTVGLTIPGSNR